MIDGVVRFPWVPLPFIGAVVHMSPTTQKNLHLIDVFMFAVYTGFYGRCHSENGRHLENNLELRFARAAGVRHMHGQRAELCLAAGGH